jgi:hypothetical protein
MPRAEAERYRAGQLQSYRKTFLSCGMRHVRFQETLTAISPDGARRVIEVAENLVPTAVP